MRFEVRGSREERESDRSLNPRTSNLEPRTFAFVFLLLLALTIFISPLLKQEVFTLRDHSDYFQPLRFFTAEELRAGRLPLWNPYSASGEPWLANPQTGVFYPPAWMFVVLPFETAYMLFLLFHLVLLGWSAYLLFARRVSAGAAMVGTVALMFSGPVLSLLDVNNNLATLAWIPLALWCAAERAPIRGGFVLALSFLAGEPFLAAVGALMYVIVSRKPRDIFVAAGVAFGTSAIQLFPFVSEIIAGGDRAGGMTKEQILQDSMPLRDWLRVVIPPSLDASAIDPKLGQHFIPVIYVGIAVAALALVGLTRVRRVAGWLALLVVAIVVAAGPPLLAQLPLTLLRYPARVVPLAALAIAALAAAGWDRIRKDRRWIDLLVILVIVVDLLPHARPLLATAAFRRDVVPYPREVGADAKFIRVGDIDPSRRPAWIAGYLNLYDRRFDANTAAPVSSERYLRFHRRVLEHPSLEALAILPAEWILTTLALPPPFERLGRAANVTLYRNRDTRAMATLITRDGIVAAKWEIGTSHARVIVDAPSDGMLVLTQQDAPAWRVAIDGKSAEKRPVFGVFRGVAVSKGRHEVLWTYRPRALFFGGAVTLITLLLARIYFFVKHRK